MEFARRGPATAAVDEGVVEERRRSLDPPSQPHGDSLHVIRDALLSQLQTDRRRQEIIEAELARIERAMALRSSAAPHHGTSSPPSANPEHVEPRVQFAFDDDEQHFAPHGRQKVGADEARDLKKGDGVHGEMRIKAETPCPEDDLVLEDLGTAGGNGKPAVQENAASGECKQESDEAVLHKKKWSCAICQVETTSEGNLLQHFAGQKHCANVIALKAKARAEKARKAQQYAGKKPGLTWVCKFCPANCTGKSGLDNHLSGKKHHAKIQALLEECKGMALDHASSQEQGEGKPADSDFIFCGTCQVKCASPSIKESHVRGKKHQMNVQALRQEAKRLGIIPPKLVKKQQSLRNWDCTICQFKCDAESRFHDHWRGLGHQQKLDALLRQGSNSNGASIEGEEQKLYFCKLCNLQCNSKSTLGEHRLGKKHLEKVEKRILSSFCRVCNLQCNSEKMLAHHCAGSKHQANLNG